MDDYRIEAASKAEWAERALAAEAKLDIAVEALNDASRLIDALQEAITKIKGKMK